MVWYDPLVNMAQGEQQMQGMELGAAVLAMIAHMHDIGELDENVYCSSFCITGTNEHGGLSIELTMSDRTTMYIETDPPKH